MRKLNDGLDPNNPSHQLVIEMNNRNESIYGPYNEKEGIFESFISKSRHEYVLPRHMEKYTRDDIEAAFEAGRSRDFESFESWLQHKKTNA